MAAYVDTISWPNCIPYMQFLYAARLNMGCICSQISMLQMQHAQQHVAHMCTPSMQVLVGEVVQADDLASLGFKMGWMLV